ncbi:hypothetical protein [Spirochaeta lutea]|uniref:Uncharacterized protein n=1 Tax=Spirochaeta lutea TaxID=1480694 RepID=A0A098QSJ9_9SPIO|nr:hypothetical protein [Spirochaeta lutea]KGE70734.1 hypothetical protein DC28_14625 [Spirochaeta lutea]
MKRFPILAFVMVIVTGCATTQSDAPPPGEPGPDHETMLAQAEETRQLLESRIESLQQDIQEKTETITDLEAQLAEGSRANRLLEEELTRARQEGDTWRTRASKLEELLQRLSFALSLGSISPEDPLIDQVSSLSPDTPLPETGLTSPPAANSTEGQQVSELFPSRLPDRRNRRATPSDSVFQEEQGSLSFLYHQSAYYGTRETVYPEIRFDRAAPGPGTLYLVLQVSSPRSGSPLNIAELRPRDVWDESLPVEDSRVYHDDTTRLERLYVPISGTGGETLLEQIISGAPRIGGGTASGGLVYLDISENARRAILQFVRIYKERGGQF